MKPFTLAAFMLLAAGIVFRVIAGAVQDRFLRDVLQRLPGGHGIERDLREILWDELVERFGQLAIMCQSVFAHRQRDGGESAIGGGAVS